MKTALMAIPLALVFALGSCNKTCYCTDATVYLGYVAFDTAETDTVILRRYDRNSNFSRLLDTIVITRQNALYTTNLDTLSIRSGTEIATLRSFYNYIFYLPSLNRSDSVFGIYEARDTEEGSPNMECNCINRVLTYRLNRDTLPIANPDSPFVYIRR
jgi:hypothetical protein